MTTPDKCNELIRAFSPGVGHTPGRDNTGGIMLDGLTRTLKNVTMAVHLLDTAYIQPGDITAICHAVDWLESVFQELEQ